MDDARWNGGDAMKTSYIKCQATAAWELYYTRKRLGVDTTWTQCLADIMKILRAAARGNVEGME